MGTLDIRYVLRLPAERVEVFDTCLDKDTLEIRNPEPAPHPAWTALEFQQCPNCPLTPDAHPHCPLALSVVGIVERFTDVISHHELDVEVVTPSRCLSTHTTSQAALRSLFGLRIACSGCPRTAFFKPMARFHLPFADGEETMSRAVSAWLIVQYFRRVEGKAAALDLDGLQEVYAQMQVVNRCTAERLRAATREDASLNAVVLLDIYAQLVPYFIQSTLEEIRGPYETFLEQLDAP